MYLKKFKATKKVVEELNQFTKGHTVVEILCKEKNHSTDGLQPAEATALSPIAVRGSLACNLLWTRITTSTTPWSMITTGDTSAELKSIRRHCRTPTTYWRDRTDTRSRDRNTHPRLECHSTLWEKRVWKLLSMTEQSIYHAVDVVTSTNQ